MTDRHFDAFTLNTRLQMLEREVEQARAGERHASDRVKRASHDIVAESRAIVACERIGLEVEHSRYLYGAWVAMNGDLLGRILSNLIVNCADAFRTHPEILNRRVLLSVTSVSESHVRVSFQDNAGGMPDTVMEALTMGMAVTTKMTGNGIGLSSARDMLNGVGGNLRFFSHVGFGSVVNVVIPKASAPEGMAESLVVPVGCNVICVDDDPSIHAIWKRRFPDRRVFAFASTADAGIQDAIRNASGKFLKLVMPDFVNRGPSDFIKFSGFQAFFAFTLCSEPDASERHFSFTATSWQGSTTRTHVPTPTAESISSLPPHRSAHSRA